MTKGTQPQRPAHGPRGRYSLRTLFLLSLVVAAPLLLLANMRNSTRPDDSLASPLYFIAGVAAVLMCAAIGNALGQRAGMYATAVGAALVWIGLVWLCSEFSRTLKTLWPVHVAAAVATVVSLAVFVRSRRQAEGPGSHEMLAQLLKVKSGLHKQPLNSDTQHQAPAVEGELPKPPPRA